MSFRSGLAILLTLLPLTAGARQLDCQGPLDDYLRHQERFSWFYKNVNTDDRAAEPFLAFEEQARRAVEHQARMDEALQLLKKRCFVAENFQRPTCADPWTKVNEINYLIGANLSRLDTLNRSPIPDERVFRQQIMDLNQNNAREAIGRLRQQRNQLLMSMAGGCIQARSLWPRVGADYLLDEPTDSAVELLREAFTAAEVPTEALSEGSYRCRVVPTDGTTGRIIEFPQRAELELSDYKVKVENGRWTLIGETYNTVVPLLFERVPSGQAIAVLPLRGEHSMQLALRVQKGGRLLVEAVGGTLQATGPRPLSLSDASDVVTSYWSCTKR